MNWALIFAGGVGQRMNTVSLPKQFLKVHGKQVIVHTIEKFQICNQIDKIVVVCISDYLDYMRELKEQYCLDKITNIVSGGKSGQESIFRGLSAIASSPELGNDDIVLIHDGVRPVIDNETLIDNIDCVRNNGTCVTIAKANETILVLENNKVREVLDRSECYLGRAPQRFYFRDIYEAHKKQLRLID